MTIVLLKLAATFLVFCVMSMAIGAFCGNFDVDLDKPRIGRFSINDILFPMFVGTGILALFFGVASLLSFIWS